jgi:molybdate transport system substrate-binding protein
VFNFAGSNTLARQILAGAAADVFVSADERWMDTVGEAGRIVPGSRRVLAGNALVLIARADSPIESLDPAGLASAPFRALALGDPESVSAGRYAKAALGAHWNGVADRVIPAPDVRAALALVVSDPEIVGIVYRTDAAASPRVRVLHEFPADAAEPIRYAAAVLRDARNGEAANAFLEFLGGEAGRAIFARHGFRPPADES